MLFLIYANETVSAIRKLICQCAITGKRIKLVINNIDFTMTLHLIVKSHQNKYPLIVVYF